MLAPCGSTPTPAHTLADGRICGRRPSAGLADGRICGRRPSAGLADGRICADFSVRGGADKTYQTSPPARTAAPALVTMVDAFAIDRPDSSSVGSQKWLSPQASFRFWIAT